MGLKINMIVLAPPLKIMIFTMGCFCILFMAVAIHADRQFNQHIDVTKNFIVHTLLVNPDDLEGFHANDLSLARLLYDYTLTKYDSINATQVAETLEQLKRPTDYGVVLLGIVGFFTAITGLSLIARATRVSEVGRGYFLEVFFGMSCFGYSVAFILGMSSALKYADTSAGKPFGCMTSEEVNLKVFHVCQLYGIKIFSGICALAAAVISAILVIIYVIFKPTPADVVNNVPVPHQSNYEYRMPKKIFGKLIDMSDLENDNMPDPGPNENYPKITTVQRS